MEELEMKTCMWEVIRKIYSVNGLQVPMEQGVGRCGGAQSAVPSRGGGTDTAAPLAHLERVHDRGKARSTAASERTGNAV